MLCHYDTTTQRPFKLYIIVIACFIICTHDHFFDPTDHGIQYSFICKDPMNKWSTFKWRDIQLAAQATHFFLPEQRFEIKVFTRVPRVPQSSIYQIGLGNNAHPAQIHGIWSKCLLPKMAESRVHMGARYIFFTFGTHSWLMQETWTKQLSAPNCKRRH